MKQQSELTPSEIEFINEVNEDTNTVKIDRAIFQKSPAEREILKAAKSKFKKENT